MVKIHDSSPKVWVIEMSVNSLVNLTNRYIIINIIEVPLAY